MNSLRLKEGLIKVVIGDKGNNRHFWLRVSRQTLPKLAAYWQRYPGFYYAKLYPFVVFDKHRPERRVLGRQWGYITRNDWKLL